MTKRIETESNQPPATLAGACKCRGKERVEPCRILQTAQSILPRAGLLEKKTFQLKQPQHDNACSCEPTGCIDAKQRQQNQAELQIILPGKMSVAVGDNFSPATLIRLLTVLENR